MTNNLNESVIPLGVCKNVDIMNDFQKQLADLLDTAQIQRGEGGSVMLYAKQFSGLNSPLIVYMDSVSEELAFRRHYLYLPAFSGEDRLLFADISYTVHLYQNGLDVYGYTKSPEGSTNKVTLATIQGRTIHNENGNYGALFNDLQRDLGSLFPWICINMPMPKSKESALIELGIKDVMSYAGIYVVPTLSNISINQYKNPVVNYAKMSNLGIGAITDGYQFYVWLQKDASGLLYRERLDYVHFMCELISKLRFVVEI